VLIHVKCRHADIAIYGSLYLCGIKLIYLDCL